MTVTIKTKNNKIKLNCKQITDDGDLYNFTLSEEKPLSEFLGDWTDLTYDKISMPKNEIKEIVIGD